MSDLLFNPREASQRELDTALAEPRSSFGDQALYTGQRAFQAVDAAWQRLNEGVIGPAMEGLAQDFLGREDDGGDTITSRDLAMRGPSAVIPRDERRTSPTQRFIRENEDWREFWRGVERRAQENMDDARVRRLALDTPDPVRSSWASEMTYGLTQMLALGTLGAVTGGSVGSAAVLGPSYGMPVYNDFLDEEVEEPVARRAALIEGVSMAALGAMPISLPGRLSTRIASGVAINVPTGMAYRGSMEAYLRSQGYEEQASRYSAFDGEMIATDAIMGAVFAGLFGQRAGGVKPAPESLGGAGEPREPTPERDRDWYFDESRLLANGGELEAAYAHALIARELGHPEAQGLADMIAEEGGESVVQDGGALASFIGLEQGLIEPTQEQIDAAMTLQADRHARVDTAPGVPLNLKAEARHAESLARAERQFAEGEEIDVSSTWADYDGEGYAPKPGPDYDAQAVGEAAIRQALEEGGFADLARDVEGLRAEVRRMGGEIGGDEALFSFGARRGADAERRSVAFNDARLTPSQNKAVEMARNGYSNAEIADELDTTAATVAVTLSQAKKRILGLEIPSSRQGAPPGRGGKTATIEDIVRLYDQLSRQGYRNRPGHPLLGRRNINTIIAERLGLTPDNVAKRLSIYRSEVAAGKREALYSMRRDIFESAVERAVANIDPKRLGKDGAMTAEQWRAFLRGPGIKAEERAWIKDDLGVNLDDYIAAREGERITREDVLAFVRQNGVRVEETVLGEPGKLSAEEQTTLLQAIEEMDRLRAEQNRIFQGEPNPARANEIADRMAELSPIISNLEAATDLRGRSTQTRWSQYTLPGGENYRELLLRLPHESGFDPAQVTFERRRMSVTQGSVQVSYRGKDLGVYDLMVNDMSTPWPHQRRERTDAEIIDIARGRFEVGNPHMRIQPLDQTAFRSSHFDQPNILAHVRFNERVSSDGKRTLFIEEVQSDWHQRGREQGYQIKPKQTEAVDTGDPTNPFNGAEIITRQQQGVPDAPFKNNAWASLALKRMIRFASENGFDQIAWTRGQHQIERFNLEKFVDALEWRFEPRIEGEQGGSTRGTLTGRKDGANIINEVMDESELPGMIGKELAERLLAAPHGRIAQGRASRTLSGVDLRVGGEGMRAFYDRIMVNIANDLGKKFGARVGETVIETGSQVKRAADGSGWIVEFNINRVNSTSEVFKTEEEARARLEEVSQNHARIGNAAVAPQTVHSLPITPEMREQALEGQALFSQTAETQGFSSVAELEARARELGVGWAEMERSAKVRIVQSSADVPAPMGLPRGVQAVHMRDTGTSYFIANNIHPDDLYGLILHEVGVHNGFEAMLGKRGFKEVLRQIDRMVEEDHPAMVQARGYAERYAANEAHIPEETLAYLIETHADLPLVQRVLSRIRQWLIKTFGSTFGMRLTVDDLRALAVTSLRRVAEQARRESNDVTPLFSSNDSPDAGQSRLRFNGLETAWNEKDGYVDLYHASPNPIEGDFRPNSFFSTYPDYNAEMFGRADWPVTRARARIQRPYDVPEAEEAAFMRADPELIERVRAQGYDALRMSDASGGYEVIPLGRVDRTIQSPDGGAAGGGRAVPEVNFTNGNVVWGFDGGPLESGSLSTGEVRRIVDSVAAQIGNHAQTVGEPIYRLRGRNRALQGIYARVLRQRGAPDGYQAFIEPQGREIVLVRNDAPENAVRQADIADYKPFAPQSPNAGDGSGEFPLFSFGGRRARTANEDRLRLARALEREGKDEWAIWHNTGWGRGVDGKWRFEIPDDGADFGVPWQTLRRRKSDTPLAEAFNHPELFEAYPILRDVAVRMSSEEGVAGSWDPNEGVIEINPKSIAFSARRTMLHEIAHAIQDIEEFAPGIHWDDISNRARMESVREDAVRRINGYTWASPEARAKWVADIDARMETYRLAAGEAEARAVERRQPGERAIPPGEATRNEVASPALLWNPRRRNWEVFRGRAASEPRQNPENLLGQKRDPIESPDYQRQIAELRGELGGEDGRAGRGDAGLRAGEEGKRTDLGAVVAVSGLRIQTRPKGSDFGTHRATIDTPIPTDADAILQARDGAEGKHTVVDFDFIDGNNPKEVRLPGVHIRWTRLNDAAKGKGIGVWIYRQLIDWADRQGLPVYSDFAISPEAQPIYGALARRGYNVEQINPHVKGSDGFIRNQKYQPIFRISRTGVEADYAAAPPPRDDYQIDGPTLRERQTRIDEQRQRQEAYDKAKPHEQVLMDEPDMMLTDPGPALFSFGPDKKIRARDAIIMSEEAQAEAIAKKKAVEATARCAIRHGGSLITVAGRGASNAALRAQMAGMEYGLIASLPVGWGVSHLAAQNADPEGYARNRAAGAAQSLQAAEARRGEAAYQAGRRAGLDAPTTYDIPQGEPLWDNVDTSRRTGADPAPEQDTPWQEGPRDLADRGLQEGPWNDPNTFSVEGGGRTREGVKVPPTPPSLGDTQDMPVDPTRDLARLLNPVRRHEE